MRKPLALAVLAITAGLTTLLWREIALPQWPVLPRLVASMPLDAATADETIAPRAVTVLSPPELPPTRSWVDATHDGRLRVDASGSLVVDADALWWLQFVFAASGELSDDEIIALARRQIDALLVEPARAQAHELLLQFVRYRARAEQRDIASASIDDAAAGFSLLRRIRIEAFGAQRAATLFADEERTQQIGWQRFQLMRDERLSASQKVQHIAELERQLPGSERAVLQRHQQWQQALGQLETLRVAGADATTLWQQRADRFGVAAADRFAELDASRQQWESRLAQYVEQARQLAPRDEAARAQLRAHYFNGAELARVTALDSLRAQQ